MRFRGGKTCVACSYIILYSRLHRYPSFIQRERRPRNIWAGGLIYTGIKMSPMPPSDVDITFFANLRSLLVEPPVSRTERLITNGAIKGK